MAKDEESHVKYNEQALVMIGLAFFLLFSYKNNNRSVINYTYSNINWCMCYSHAVLCGMIILSYKIYELLKDFLVIANISDFRKIYSSGYIQLLLLFNIKCIILYALTQLENTSIIAVNVIIFMQLVCVYYLLSSSSYYIGFIIPVKTVSTVLTVIGLSYYRGNAFINSILFSISIFLMIFSEIMLLYKCFQDFNIESNIEDKWTLINLFRYFYSNSTLIRHFFGKIFLISMISFYTVENNLLDAFNFGNFILLFSLFHECLNVSNGSLAQRLVTEKNELESKSAFIRIMFHEVRSPLSTINLGIEMLIENTNKSISSSVPLNICDIDETLRDIKVSVDVALTSINDLLSLDKIKSNMMILNKNEFPVNDFIFQSLRPFRVQAKANNIKLQYECLDNKTQQSIIFIDLIRLEQVLRNLISNALKFSLPGGTVTISTETLTEFSKDARKKIPGTLGVVRISVKDQGVGISKENQKKLFRQYVQIDPHKLQHGKGSGLGLWLSKSIIDLHDGLIDVISEGDGTGSTFYIELPLYESTIDHIKIPSAIELAKARTLHNDLIRQSPLSSNKIKAISKPNLNIISSPHSSETSSGPQTAYSRYSNAITSAGKGFMSTNKKYFSETPQSDTSNNSANFVDTKNQPEKFKSSLSTIFSEFSSPSATTLTSPRFQIRAINTNADTLTFQKLNILIVDDSSIGRKMVQKVLVDFSNVCGQAGDGVEAYNIIISDLSFYDVVLIDCFMPKMNGPEAIKLMREAGYTGVILGVTGSATSEDDQAFTNNGADGVIHKPLSVKNFREILKSLEWESPLNF